MLDELRARFPRYLIDRHPGRLGREARYVAWTRDLSLAVVCVITADPAELAAELAAAPGGRW